MIHEALMRNQRKNGQMNRPDLERLKITGNYIVDSYCAEGEARDACLVGLGLTVIQIPVVSVLRNMDGASRTCGTTPPLRAPLRRRGINLFISCRHPSGGRELITSSPPAGTPPEDGN